MDVERLFLNETSSTSHTMRKQFHVDFVSRSLKRFFTNGINFTYPDNTPGKISHKGGREGVMCNMFTKWGQEGIYNSNRKHVSVSFHREIE